MATWSDLVTSADAGGTADTFDSVGTVTLNNVATRIVGLWMAGATITTTAAEANLGQFRFDFADQGFGRYLVGGPPSSGSATGTQSQGNKMEAVLLPVDIRGRGGGAIANTQVPIEFSTHVPDPTAGASVVAGVMYTDDANPNPFFGQHFPGPAPSAGSDSEGVADASGTGETAITDINIPAWASRIVGVQIDSNHDAAGANGEEMVGMVRFRSSIVGFEPQEYPLPAINAPLAGTIAGTGVWSNALSDHYWAMDFPTGGANQTVTPNVLLNAAVTGAVAHSSSVLYI